MLQWIIHSQYMVEIMLKFRQNIMVGLMNIFNTIYKKWFVTISDELQSNVIVLKDMIEVRNAGKVCENLGMDHVQFIIDDICIN